MTYRQTFSAIAFAAAAGAAATGASAQETFKYGTVAFKGDAGLVMMATKDQFDAKYGLDIEPVSLKGDTLLLRALLAGELDAYLGNPGSPIVAASKGGELKIVGCPWPDLTYALYTKPEVETVADLKGGTIGVSAPGSLPDLFARGVIQAAGMTSDDVGFVVAGSDSERVAAAVAGVITAAPSSSEFQARAPELGLKMLVHARDVVPEYMRLCIITTADKLENEPEKMTNFLAAQIEAFNFALANKEETIALSKEIANLPEDDTGAELIFDEVTEFGSIVPEMPVDVSKLEWLRDLLIATGSMEEGFDPASMVDTATLEAAKALVDTDG